MDSRIRTIISSKSAGVYFVVTDNSAVAEIAAEQKMRLFFINSQKGPVNNLVEFAAGDTVGFTSIFGKPTKQLEKKGNFSHQTCLDALSAGPIAVVNLRAFDEIDTTSVVGFKDPIQVEKIVETPYTNLFKKTSFWIEDSTTMENIVDNLLSIGVTGNNNKSVFVRKITDKNSLSNVISDDYNKTISETDLVIDSYDCMNPENYVGDSFVEVYVFDNTFDKTTVNTNQFYGHLFDASGNISIQNIDVLKTIPQAGFYTSYIGSLIPDLMDLSGNALSIDLLLNQDSINSGIISNINIDYLENLSLETGDIIFGNSSIHSLQNYNLETNTIPAKTNNLLFSMQNTTINVILNPDITTFINSKFAKLNVLVTAEDETKYSVNGFDSLNLNGYKCINENLPNELLTIVALGKNEYSFYDSENNIVTGLTNIIIENHNKSNESIDYLIAPTNLSSYIPREAQFINGTSARQSAILDMMLTPGIVKGLIGMTNLRYVVDCFKSYPESSYKYQYAQLMQTLDDSNRFVRFIGAEPFISDMEKSIDPMFRDNFDSSFNPKYIETGGNTLYTTNFMSKPVTGAEFCFFFGPHDIVRNVEKIITGKISNAFYQKSIIHEPVANESGYIDGITELEYPFDDTDRFYCEKAQWNPIIYFGGGNTIFGNMTAQKKQTALQQIHVSELLAYIKYNLYALNKSETFKKSNYDDYLRIETTAKNFMNSLALEGAIDANPIVICNATNNTLEVRKQKIKLVHVEFTPVDVADKIIFDLKIN